MLTSKKITELDLEFVKEYLKVDYAEEDNFISSIIIAAKSYMQTALGYKIETEFPVKEDIPEEFTVAALLLISHWFDNRQMQTTGTLGNEISFAFSAIIDAHKRPLKSEYEDEDGVIHLV